MKRKSIFVFLISLLVLMAILPACSSNKTSTGGTNSSTNPSNPSNQGGKSQESEKKGQVTLRFWFPGETKINNDYFLNVAEEFTKKNPNIKIETTILPTSSKDVETKLNAAKLGGNYPDVFSAYLIFMGTRGSRGEFANLDEYIKKWEDKDDIFDSAYSAGKYQGKTIGLGFYPAPVMFVYRKDFFQEAGLNPNNPPKTWEELANYAEKLTVRDSSGKVTRAGLDIPVVDTANVYFETFLRQNGSKVIDETSGVPAFNDQPSIEALKYLVDLKNKNVNIPFRFDEKDQFPFLKGQSAISMLITPQINTLLKDKPELKDKIGYMPMLERKAKTGFSGNRLFTIGQDSKHKDEAWEFIKFMMSKEQMWKRYEDLKITPVRKSLEKDFVSKDPEFNKAVLDYLNYGKGKAVVPWTSIYDQHMSLAYEEAMSGKKSPEQALKDAQTNLENEIKKFGK